LLPGAKPIFVYVDPFDPVDDRSAMLDLEMTELRTDRAVPDGITQAAVKKFYHLFA
jgi:hypothetical protein